MWGSLLVLDDVEGIDVFVCLFVIVDGYTVQ